LVKPKAGKILIMSVQHNVEHKHIRIKCPATSRSFEDQFNWID